MHNHNIRREKQKKVNLLTMGSSKISGQVLHRCTEPMRDVTLESVSEQSASRLRSRASGRTPHTSRTDTELNLESVTQPVFEKSQNPSAVSRGYLTGIWGVSRAARGVKCPVVLVVGTKNISVGW